MHASTPPAGGAPDGVGEVDVDLVDAFIAASRALVAVAARSLAGLDEDVTLPQYRMLVVLASRGAQRSADLAASLDVSASTASRMVERLVRKGLVDRRGGDVDRRAVAVSLSGAGAHVVERVTAARRREVTRILAQMPSRGRRGLVTALRAFAAAAGEVPDRDWAVGWVG